VPLGLVVVCLLPGAARAEPTWCKGATEKINVSDYDWKDFREGDDARHAVRTLVGAKCFPNDDTRKDAAIIDEGFAKWSKLLDMTESDWADAADYTATKYPNTLYMKEKAAWSSLGAIDQWAGISRSTMGASNLVVDPSYLVDAIGPKLTELGRAAYVNLCVSEDEDVALWAMCQGDVEALDRAKVASDLRGDGSQPGHQKMLIRMELLALWPKLEKHQARVKELQSKDPGYAKMFEVAAAARKEWSQKADPKLVELATAIDDARVTNSRSAQKGCGERTWDAFRGVVGGMPAKTFDGIVHDLLKSTVAPLEQVMAHVINTPNGYLAALALHLCARFEDKPDYLARIIGGSLSRWPGFRGPRTAAHTAILTTGVELDDRDAKIEYPDIGRPWIYGDSSSGGGGFGEISKVKVEGEKATVEFAKVKSKQQECVKGRQTNRLRQIRSDGTLVYEYLCQQWKTVTLNEPPFPPQTVNAIYAGGLKKGNFVYVVEDVVVAAYPKNGDSTPHVVAGVPVK
jgi:hypothetical protein